MWIEERKFEGFRGVIGVSKEDMRFNVFMRWRVPAVFAEKYFLHSKAEA
jgi:hypothetical protein